MFRLSTWKMNRLKYVLMRIVQSQDKKYTWRTTRNVYECFRTNKVSHSWVQGIENIRSNLEAVNMSVSSTRKGKIIVPLFGDQMEEVKSKFYASWKSSVVEPGQRKHPRDPCSIVCINNKEKQRNNNEFDKMRDETLDHKDKISIKDINKL